MKKPIPVNFYIPSNELLKQIPKSVENYWEWFCEFIPQNPIILPDNLKNCTWSGPYNWTVQTYLYLSSFGYSCKMTANLSEKGMIISHSDFLSRTCKPNEHQIIIEIKPDRNIKSIFSNFYIVQNRHDPIKKGVQRHIFKSAFLNHWPQPSLIPRNRNRGEKFKNICYFGGPEQFLPETDLVQSELSKMGLTFKMIPTDKWHDYSEVDAIIACRPRKKGKEIRATEDTERKPASKLINAWIAGVPAILSSDIAFEDIRKSNLDYLRAENVLEIKQQLSLLKDDLALREAMIENGRQRSAEFSVEKCIQMWVKVLNGPIAWEYRLWTKSKLYRKFFYLFRSNNSNNLAKISFQNRDSKLIRKITQFKKPKIISQIVNIRDYLIIRRSKLFDSNFYLDTYPDVRKADIDPLLHFVRFGWKEGRNPSNRFNTNGYRSTQLNRKETDINPLVHYLQYGKRR